MSELKLINLQDRFRLTSLGSKVLGQVRVNHREKFGRLACMPYHFQQAENAQRLRSVWRCCGRPDCATRWVWLEFFETLGIKLERPTILSDSADDVLWSTGRHVSFNFKGDLHLRIEQAGKMLNYGSGYRINVARQPGRIQCR